MQPDRLDDSARALELLAMEPEQAVFERWLDGRARYGDTWHGRHPLVEAYLEAIDVPNYIDQAVRIGALAPELARALRMQSLDTARGIRTAAATVLHGVAAGIRKDIEG